MIKKVSSYASTYSSNILEDNFRNFIINGDFRINQRSFATSTTSGAFNFDRWFHIKAGDGSAIISSQNHTVGAPPQQGLDSPTFLRMATSSQTTTAVTTYISQRIEDVRSLAGDMVTISFWAKAATGAPSIAIELTQEFGSGGSADVNTLVGRVTIGTGWARYTRTIFNPSISGKTIGENSALRLNLWVSAGSLSDARTGALGIQNNTFDIWGVQVERGIYMSNFEQNHIADELSICQRYYFRITPPSQGARYGYGHANSGTLAQIYTPFPVAMRVIPSSVETNNTASSYEIRYVNSFTACSAVPSLLASNTTNVGTLSLFTIGSTLLSNGQSVAGATAVSGTGFLAWSAEI